MGWRLLPARLIHRPEPATRRKVLYALGESQTGRLAFSLLAAHRDRIFEQNPVPVIPYTSGRRWQLCPVSSGFRPFRRKEKAAKETCNNDLIAVSVLATYCMDQGWIKQRPKIKKFKTRVRIRYLEPDQVTVYMASLRGAFRLLFQVLIGTGLRFGEAAGLRVCDLRFGACEARALIEDSKTQNGVRTVFIPDWITDGLKKEIEARELSGTDRIFTIPYDTCYDEHKRACKLAGIVNYTIHDHRHTAAVALARSGMPLHMLAEQLGHATIQMTMRYAKFNPDYGDVSPYFQRVAQSFGLTSGSNPGSTSPKDKTGAPA